MITYAEQFLTMAAAKARWGVLEQRQKQAPECECFCATAYLDEVPHVLLVAVTLPRDFLDGPTGQVRSDVDPGVFQTLWWRHVNRREDKGPHRTVITRPEDKGIRL